jgi:hypothetical protein
MTSAVFDFKDIRARMFGDLKAELVPALTEPCRFCRDTGWLLAPYSGQHVVCSICFNPKGLPSP